MFVDGAFEPARRCGQLKDFMISKGLRDHSWQAVLDEIAKCNVVCANCHRR